MSAVQRIQHEGEQQSNALRNRLFDNEPACLRTFTSSLAVIEKSAGAYHYTPEGRKLADFSSGVLVANLGHNPTRWWKKLLQNLQIDELDESSSFVPAAPLTAYNAASTIEIEATDRLLANMRSQPGGKKMERVMWSASGSEAIQKALWACLKFKPGADKIIATRGGFHGKKGLAGAITGSEDDSDRDPRVRFISFPKEECMDVSLRAEPLALEKYEAELDALKDELGDSIACLVTEPYLGGGGSFHPQTEYLQLLERFCRDNNALFVLDEIQSNFGRTGPMYAFTHYGVEPDIVCLGKGLGNGVPVSAAVGRNDVFEKLLYGEGSDTWSANPLSSAAVVATLDEFESTDVLDQGLALSKIIEAGLEQLKQTNVIVNVRGEGCVWGIECAAIGNHSSDQVANLCVEACYLGNDDGDAIHLLGPLAGNVLRVSPPLTMELTEAARYLAVMFDIFERLNKQLEK